MECLLLYDGESFCSCKVFSKQTSFRKHFTDCVRVDDWTEIKRRNEGKWVNLQQTNLHEKKEKKKKSKLCLTVLGLIVEVFAFL